MSIPMPDPRNPLEIKRCVEAVCAVLGEDHHLVQYYNGVKPGAIGWGLFQAGMRGDWEQNFTEEQRAAIAVAYRLS